MKTVSVCVLAYNEEKFLPGVLRDIEMQTYPADHIEVVLIDSGSLDRTRNLMENFCKKNKDRFLNIQVIDNPGRIQSCGWNEAIVHFTSDVMIRVDAHSHIPPEFVQKNMENLAQGELVSGGIRPTLTEGEDAFSRTLLLAENSMFGSSVSTARRGGNKTYVKSFFHGAYDRKVLETVGGFREDLGRTEDNEFHYRIRQHGYQLAMSPDIVSYQYIRPTLWKKTKIWKWILDRVDSRCMSGVPVRVSFCSICFCRRYFTDYDFEYSGVSAARHHYVEHVWCTGSGNGVAGGGWGNEETWCHDLTATHVFVSACSIWSWNLDRTFAYAFLAGKAQRMSVC